MARARGFRKGLKRRRVSPAPGLHPPGMGSTVPQGAALGLEPRGDVERRFLQHVTRLQVRGQAAGWPDMMRIDWDRMKLQESMWLTSRVEKTPVDVIKLSRGRAMRAQFNGYGRIVSIASKAKEARHGELGETEIQNKNREQAKVVARAPSSGPVQEPRTEGVGESPFIKTLRARAFDLAAMGRVRERDHDPE